MLAPKSHCAHQLDTCTQQGTAQSLIGLDVLSKHSVMVGLFLDRQLCNRPGKCSCNSQSCLTARADYTDYCTKTCMVTTSHKEQHADEGCAEVVQGQSGFARACVPGQATLQHGRGSHDHTGANVIQVLGGLEVGDVLEHEGIGGLCSMSVSSLPHKPCLHCLLCKSDVQNLIISSVKRCDGAQHCQLHMVTIAHAA